MPITVRPPDEVQDIFSFVVYQLHANQEVCDDVHGYLGDSALGVNFFFVEVIGAARRGKHGTLNVVRELELDCAHRVFMRDQLVVDLAQLDALSSGEVLQVLFCRPCMLNRCLLLVFSEHLQILN